MRNARKDIGRDYNKNLQSLNIFFGKARILDYFLDRSIPGALHNTPPSVHECYYKCISIMIRSQESHHIKLSRIRKNRCLITFEQLQLKHPHFSTFHPLLGKFRQSDSAM